MHASRISDPARIQGTEIFQHMPAKCGVMCSFMDFASMSVPYAAAGCDVPRHCVSRERGHCRVLHRHQELRDVKACTQGCHACGAIPLFSEGSAEGTGAEAEAASGAEAEAASGAEIVWMEYLAQVDLDVASTSA